MPCVLSIKKPFHLDSEFIYLPDIKELDQLHSDWLNLCDERDSEKNEYKNHTLYMKARDAERKYNTKRAEIIRYEDEKGDRIDGWHTLMKQLPRGVKSTAAEVDGFQQELIQEGHDGIYLGDTAADFASRSYAGTDWWIAFHPNQIKSVFAKSFTDSNNIME